jgi:transposase, IS5 family
VDERVARLSDLGDQLEAFSRAVDFEQFRPDLKQALADVRPCNVAAGR